MNIRCATIAGTVGAASLVAAMTLPQSVTSAATKTTKKVTTTKKKTSTASTTLGEAAYYRIQGPKVYIEFSHQVDGGPNAGGWTHIHAMYRDPGNDYGASFKAA